MARKIEKKVISDDLLFGDDFDENKLAKMEEELIAKLGTKVEIRHSGGKGRIEISYYSIDDFERIVEKIK